MGERTTTGYCTACVKNMPHIRRLESPGALWADVLSLRATRLFRIGPWECTICGRRAIYLHHRRGTVGTYAPPGEAAVESAGNYIRTKESLVLRKKRLSRYSEKYRDGIVRKILEGRTSVNQTGVELDISDRDVMDWVADFVERKQSKINELESQLKSFQRAAFNQAKLAYEPVSFAEGENTVDGNVR